MRDTVSLYTFSQDMYGTKEVTLVGTVAGLLIVGEGISRPTGRVQEDSDATLFLDPANSTIASVAGKIEGMIVKAQKQNYAEVSDAEHWYEIRSERVSTDSLRGNRTAFIRCRLQKIEQPPLAGESS